MLYKCSMTCWPSPTLSACLRRGALIGMYLLCGFVGADCAVLAVLRYSSNSGRCSTTCSYMVIKKAHKKRNKWGTMALLQHEKGNTRRQVIEGGNVQVGALSG